MRVQIIQALRVVLQASRWLLWGLGLARFLAHLLCANSGAKPSYEAYRPTVVFGGLQAYRPTGLQWSSVAYRSTGLQAYRVAGLSDGPCEA